MYGNLIAQVIVMSQRILAMEAKSVMETPRETTSPTSVLEDSIFLEFQSGFVKLMEIGQGLSQSVNVCSMPS